MSILQNWKKEELRKVNALYRHTTSQQQEFTLADGSKILIHSEDENWVGKIITMEDFTPLAPGEYDLAPGRDSDVQRIIVGHNSTIKKTISNSALESIEKKIKAIKTL